MLMCLPLQALAFHFGLAYAISLEDCQPASLEDSQGR